ncbi:hypothetical protein DGG96_13945 [Legionella qingyii]|uniref:Uncharacterized protein n=1 Tax=Legionella qingyii TaxID=2184757 RepID=A0A317TZL3_9GAMM|nr:hypothetical protein [Legionella qingyii]PWY55011.1 hypothetical protein DGG96_13945 [Legionella qingyii]RUR26385.1 hypothetical protein ELY20_00215 [Legionella qingyii]RUR27406.1 hypothetical protein ELY16_04560 [Legionella qingyii]
MKFEKIEYFLKKAGFQLTHEGVGFGEVEGCPSYLYQKNILGSTPQMIQLAVSGENKEDIHPVYSDNVPKLVRDSVNNIINNNMIESANIIRF